MSQNPASRDDLIAEGRALFDKYVLPERERREKDMTEVLDGLLDSLESSALSPKNPLLSVAYPLGNGWDKALGHWSVNDWQYAFIHRYRTAKTPTLHAEAKRFQDQAEGIIQVLMRFRARTINDLFTDGPWLEAVVAKVATKASIRAGNALRGDHAEITPEDMYTPLEIDMDGKTGVRLLRDLRAQDLRNWVDSERIRTGLDTDPEYWGALNAANEMDREGLQTFDDHIYAVFGPMIVD